MSAFTESNIQPFKCFTCI